MSELTQDDSTDPDSSRSSMEDSLIIITNNKKDSFPG